MTTELQNYLDKMYKEYDEITNLIEIEFNNKGKDNLLWYFLDNNDNVKKYITHFTTGANLNSKEDNEIAYIETYKRHVKFMNRFYKLYSGYELFKESVS